VGERDEFSRWFRGGQYLPRQREETEPNRRRECKGEEQCRPYPSLLVETRAAVVTARVHVALAAMPSKRCIQSVATHNGKKTDAEDQNERHH